MASASRTEMISGQIWLRVPQSVEWGLEKFLIIQTESDRLILCWAVNYTENDESGMPIGSGTEFRPIKRTELGEVVFKK